MSEYKMIKAMMERIDNKIVVDKNDGCFIYMEVSQMGNDNITYMFEAKTEKLINVWC